MNADDERHGTRRGYYAHRKAGQDACGPCKRAAAAAEARYALLRSRGVQSRLPALGVQRRLQALYALGWTWTALDQELGLFNMAEKWGNQPISYVFPQTHRLIADLYDRLSMRLPPMTTIEERRAASRARNGARRRGWAPPMAYVEIDDPKDVPLMNERLTRWDSFEDRFWGQVNKTETCWLWMGRLTKKGYGGRIGHLGKHYYPHQLAYIVEVGPIPDGLVIDHLCRVRSCVNPAHLEPVTAEENTRRGAEARWSEPCPNGHDPSFRGVQPNGKARCSECEREGGRRYYERHAEKKNASARDRYNAWMATVDDAMVERALAGEHSGRASRATRDEVLRRWGSMGRTWAELERITGWNIARDLRRLRGQEEAA